MDTLFAIAILAGMGYAVFCGLKWMLRSGQARARHGDPLTPADLRLLEESAARITADLRAVTDECVAKIERACLAAEERISASTSIAPYIQDHVVPQPAPRSRSILAMIDASESVTSIARQAGLMTGEVELMRDLRSIGAPSADVASCCDAPPVPSFDLAQDEAGFAELS